MKSGSQLVAIAGGSGSGKTWLARTLQSRIGNTAGRISLDDFYRDRSDLTPAQRSRINFDHPRAVDWNLFDELIRKCASSRSVSLPVYDFATHARLPAAKAFKPTPVVLVDGLWLLRRPTLRSLFALRIFIDCPASTRLARRLRRDVVERGREPRSVRNQFQTVVAPMHDRYVAPQRKWADIVLKGRIGESQIRSVLDRIEILLNPPD